MNFVLSSVYRFGMSLDSKEWGKCVTNGILCYSFSSMVYIASTATAVLLMQLDNIRVQDLSLAGVSLLSYQYAMLIIVFRNDIAYCFACACMSCFELHELGMDGYLEKYPRNA